MSVTAERQRFARIGLSFVAEPGDLVLGGPAQVTEGDSLRVPGSLSPGSAAR